MVFTQGQFLESRLQRNEASSLPVASLVIKAVYIEKRDLKCACVGGGANVPLGFVSLSENLAMMGMGLWMIVKAI